ncbi:hypothetical protein BH18ACT11_BH18ACT11_18230 [soil metagenome]
MSPDTRSARAVSRLAWSLWALSVALTALGLLLLVPNLSAHVYDYWLENTLGAVLFATVGAIVASRRPENPVGWLLCFLGVANGIGHFSSQYAIYALLARPDELPAGQAMAWVASWILPPIIGLQVFAFLLFPTGRLPGRRWRWLAWLTVAFVVAGVISSAFSLGANTGLGPVQNPLGIEGFSELYTGVVLTVSSGLYVAVAFSLFVRLRRAGGVERQQIKWFAYAVVATVVGTTIAYAIPDAIGTPLWFEWAGYALVVATTPAIPVSIGIAILRYRLYDIDRIINRTLVYGSLTATLVALYFGVVVTTQALLGALAGQDELPQLAVVASTLVVAALFNPLRHRTQEFIDRRFYRSKYDAKKTLEEFSAKLRDHTDLEVLGKDVVAVVRETMQPAHASLWLKETGSSKASERP